MYLAIDAIRQLRDPVAAAHIEQIELPFAVIPNSV
jgi:hypothetical protein